jgi:hypothetical protein
MNCDAIQHALLGLLRPDQPPAVVQAHLAQCPVCRAGHERLLQIERQLPLLPVPSSTAKADLLRRLRADAVAPPRDEPIPFHGRQVESRGERIRKVRERAKQKLALAAALAAALVLFAVGWAVWQHQLHTIATPEPVSVQALVSRLNTREPRLAEVLAGAPTPRERVEILAVVADRLLERSRPLQLAADRDELAALAQLYGDVIRDGLVAHARTLPVSQRAAVLNPILRQLEIAQRDAEQMAVQAALVDNGPVASANAASLRAIAAAAQEAYRRLNDLIDQTV